VGKQSMMDIIPLIIDGAIVLNLDNGCTVRTKDCDKCTKLVVYLHNWIKQTKLEYLIFDFQEEKNICPTFIEELMQLRKRLHVPFLFSGIMKQSQDILNSYSCSDTFPFFWTPEDAIRALRIQSPGLTEIPAKIPIHFGGGILDAYKGGLSTLQVEEKVHDIHSIKSAGGFVLGDKV
tara:strand:- start:360 stop:890 length:531 start_codon:yes stop_codon:yes gene_type:complete